ncbi:hypothetical protein H0H93_005935, partial [Arthromyces matolae]
GTQLYPRGPPSKDCLMERATFQDPHLDGWIKVVNADLDKAKLNLQRTKKRFDKVRQIFAKHPIGKSTGKQQPQHLKFL